MRRSVTSRVARPRRASVRSRWALASVIVIGLLLHAGCVAGTDAGCEAVLQAGTLEPGAGFGDLRVGMSQAEIRRLIGPPERTMGEAWEYLSCGFAVAFSRAQPTEVGALLAGDSGDSELTEHFTVKTPEGLGMGSSREEIEAALGAPDETRGPDSGVETLFYPDQGVSWTLRDGEVVHLTIRRPR